MRFQPCDLAVPDRETKNTFDIAFNDVNDLLGLYLKKSVITGLATIMMYVFPLQLGLRLKKSVMTGLATIMVNVFPLQVVKTSQSSYLLCMNNSTVDIEAHR